MTLSDIYERAQQIRVENLTAAGLRDWELLVTLADLARYAKHLDHCKKLSQMPMIPQHQYTLPRDWDNWRDAQPCDCGLANMLTRLEALKP